MHTGEGWRLGHRPALDGVRGVAVLLVVAAHAWRPVGVWGTVGVTMFFTLSGFLITALLLEEHTRTGRVRLLGFYQRRAVRLLPALAVFLVAAVVVGFASPAAALAALGYMSNWMLAFGTVDMAWLGHTWSLSIEEQFYLLWPLIVIGLARTRNPRQWMLAACAAGIGWAWVARPLFWDDGAGHMRVYMGLDTRADALLVGCALAALMSGRRVRRRLQVPLLDAAVPLVALLAVAASGAVADYLLLPMWLPVATAGFIFLAVTGASSRLLSSATLRWVGRRSYALYLWHLPVVYYANRSDSEVATAAAIGLSLLLAEASWRFVEQPARRLFGRRSLVAADTAAPAAVAGRGPAAAPIDRVLADG